MPRSYYIPPYRGGMSGFNCFCRAKFTLLSQFAGFFWSKSTKKSMSKCCTFLSFVCEQMALAPSKSTDFAFLMVCCSWYIVNNLLSKTFFLWPLWNFNSQFLSRPSSKNFNFFKIQSPNKIICRFYPVHFFLPFIHLSINHP